MIRAARLSAPPRRGARLWAGLFEAALLILGFLVLTVLASGPLHDLDMALNQKRNISEFWPILVQIDRIGQRAVCLPVLLAIAGLAGWRSKTWRPLIVAGVSVLFVNAFVALFKFSLMRGSPLANNPDFLEQGTFYPSGHTTNVVLVYGLAAYLWWRYANSPKDTRWVMIASVTFLTMVMIATSLALRWHWFTDLIAGVLVGAAALRAAMSIDQAIPLTSRSRTSADVTRPEAPEGQAEPEKVAASG